MEWWHTVLCDEFGRWRIDVVCCDAANFDLAKWTRDGLPPTCLYIRPQGVDSRGIPDILQISHLYFLTSIPTGPPFTWTTFHLIAHFSQATRYRKLSYGHLLRAWIIHGIVFSPTHRRVKYTVPMPVRIQDCSAPSQCLEMVVLPCIQAWKN